MGNVRVVKIHFHAQTHLLFQLILGWFRIVYVESGYRHGKEAPAECASLFSKKGAVHRGLIRRDINVRSVLLSVGPREKRCYITAISSWNPYVAPKKVKFFRILDVLFDGRAFIIAVNGESLGKIARKPARLCWSGGLHECFRKQVFPGSARHRGCSKSYDEAVCPHNSHYGDNRDKRKHRNRHPSERNVINMIHARQLHTLSGHATFSCAALMYGFRKRHGERRLIKGLWSRQINWCRFLNPIFKKDQIATGCRL